MKHVLSHTLAVIALGLATFAVTHAHAQTIAVGPYYATPSWDQTLGCSALASCPRFIVLSNFNNAAVLDRDTGLIWDRAPNGGGDWASMSQLCMESQIGGHFGWRLPSVPELMSLLDPTQSNPALPPGNPFNDVFISSQLGFWTSNPTLVFPDRAWVVNVNNATIIQMSTTDGGRGFWCVRGPAPDASPR